MFIILSTIYNSTLLSGTWIGRDFKNMVPSYCRLNLMWSRYLEYSVILMSTNLLISCFFEIRVITKLPNSEQSYKEKVKTHNYINRQNQSTTGKLWKRNDPDLVPAFLKKWWVESDFKNPNNKTGMNSRVSCLL